MQKFDSIRPFYDTEVNDALSDVIQHPMMKALMNFSFPDVADEVWKEQLKRTHSIRDFQCNFIYQSVRKILEKSSEGLTTSGFEHLEKNTSYFFISNHRDILLDTTFIKATLVEQSLLKIFSNIKNNLVNISFL